MLALSRIAGEGAARGSAGGSAGKGRRERAADAVQRVLRGGGENGAGEAERGEGVRLEDAGEAARLFRLWSVYLRGKGASRCAGTPPSRLLPVCRALPPGATDPAGFIRARGLDDAGVKAGILDRGPAPLPLALRFPVALHHRPAASLLRRAPRNRHLIGGAPPLPHTLRSGMRLTRPPCPPDSIGPGRRSNSAFVRSA